MTREEALEIAGRCWCDKRNSGKVIDVDLAESFADAMMQAVNDSRHTPATRALIDAYPAYGAVGAEPVIEQPVKCDGIGFTKCERPAMWRVETIQNSLRRACDRCKQALEVVRDQRREVLAAGEGFHLDTMTFSPLEKVKP